MRGEDYGSQLRLCVSVSVTTKRATPLVEISKLVCLPKVNGVEFPKNALFKSYGVICLPGIVLVVFDRSMYIKR